MPSVRARAWAAASESAGGAGSARELIRGSRDPPAQFSSSRPRATARCGLPHPRPISRAAVSPHPA